MTEMKNCPFCKSESEIEQIYYEGPVALIPRCTKNGCIGYSYLEFHDDEDVAIAAWNHRPIEDELRARIKELEEQVLGLCADKRIAELEAEFKDIKEREEDQRSEAKLDGYIVADGLEIKEIVWQGVSYIDGASILVSQLSEWCEQEIKETKHFNSITGVMREILKSRYLRANDLLDKFCKVKK